MIEGFDLKNKKELKKLPLEEVEDYYRSLRKAQYEQNMPIEGIEKRKENYSQIKFLMQLDKIMNLRTMKIVGDKRVETNAPKIYACTHIGRYDIESTVEALNESAWFLMGDPGETYLNFDGVILDKVGVIYFDMDNKLDRHIAQETCIKILQQGGNVFMFPEGAWNLDPIYPVQKLFPGIAEMVIRTGAEVIPVGIEQYRGKLLKNYYVNIGKNLVFENARTEDKEVITEIIRCKMTDLKWDIWEQHGLIKRSSLLDDWDQAKEAFINSIMCDTENGYTVEEIEKTRFHEKNKHQTPNEVFSYLNNLDININNAFLAKSVYQYEKSNVKMLKL